MKIQKALEWIVSGDTGISSKTMWAAIMGVEPCDPDVPYDTGDFGRCYRMCQKCDVSKQDLGVVPIKFPYWKPIIDNWDKLCRLYEAKDYEGVYNLLDSFHDEIMSLKGYTKTGKDSWQKKGSFVVSHKIH
jgi:hypothetical protein